MKCFPRVNQPVLSLMVLAPIVALICLNAVAQQPVVSADSANRERGIDLFRSGEIKSAIKALNLATKQNENDGEAWYYLGLALTRDDQISKARKAFEVATELRPDFGPAHAGYSYALLLTAKTSEAGKEARRAIQLDDQLAEAHYVLGVVHLREGNHAEAELESSRALKIKPVFPLAYLLKYQALLALYTKRVVTPAAADQDPETTRQAREKGKELFRQATEALQAYIDQNPTNLSGVWREQLASMRIFNGGGSDVLNSSQVSTRAKVLRKPEPSYTNQARDAGVTGTVVLRAVFASDGQVKLILVLADVPYGLTEAAVAAARQIKFVPAMKDGKPVSMYMQLEYNFNLF